MSSLLKNKTFVIVLVAVVVVLLLGVGGFVFVNHNLTEGQSDDQTQYLDQNVTKLSPSAIGLTMVAASDKKHVKFVINKPNGFTKLEYELSYMANSTASDRADGAPAQVSRGITSDDIALSSGKPYDSGFLLLGTSSSGTDRPDTGVTSVHLLLKLTKTDGKLYQVEDELKL